MSKRVQSLNWPDAARALNARIHVGIEPSVLAYLQALPQQELVVACSGGADSLAMLCLLWAQRGELGCRITVAHYNHRWRAEASEQDAEFVRKVAAALDLPFCSESRPDDEAAFTETTARELRLRFLRQVARQTGASCIALGHQKDDILETQLMRLARGAGADGLAAPRPVHDFSDEPAHLRPILHLRAGDLRMALNLCGIPWCEDRSNEDVRIARNALRIKVIPELIEATGRNAPEGAARSRRLLEEDADALDALARERLSDAYEGASALDRALCRSTHMALLRRAVSHWLHNDEGIQTVSAQLMDQLLEAIRSRQDQHRFSIASCFILMDAQRIWLEPAKDAVDSGRLEACVVEPGETALLSTGALFETEWVELNAPLRARILGGGIDPADEVYLDLEPVESLTVRPWEAGDRYRPLGAPGSRKLQDCFTDRRVPQRERLSLPVVTAASGSILWVPGFPPAETCKIHPGTQLALRLTYRMRDSL
ncbi:tRNA lysidine(34) synthetase TilS [Coraliomargarita parva]|uniref:tRNA lysidine(34) synthetase TilS n=1 Tax=Coraliomargarita parva TaxID=3014050 RepID=UPI0022B39971|nr:tRNA lysidine(34) synthetase TilS [Coraliomargarita parva]